jgi:hypothetical protein
VACTSAVGRHLVGESARGSRVQIHRVGALESTDPRERRQLDAALASAAHDGGHARLGPRQVPGRHRGGGARAEHRDLHGVHQGERPTGLAVREHDDALDRRKAPARGVPGEIRVELGRDVETREPEAGRLDMEASVRHVEAEHSGTERPARALQREGLLDRRDALVERQEGRHVPAGEQQGHRVSTWRMVA